MGQPRIQRIAKRHHTRAPVSVQNVQIERHTGFEIGQLEQAFHHDVGFQTPRLRLEDDPDVFRRLVPDIGEERQFLRLKHVGHALDEA